MELEVDSVSERHGEVEVDISVRGSDSVTLSLDDVLENTDNDTLLDRMSHEEIWQYVKDHDAASEDDIREYAKEQEWKLEGTEVNADTIIAWLRTADDLQLFAVAAAVTATLAKRGELILEAHK